MNIKDRIWSIVLIGALAFFIYMAYGLLAPGAYNAVFEWPGFHWLTTGQLPFGAAEAVIAVIVVGLLAGLLSSLVHQRREAH